jgi:hypothetical protein
LKTPLLNVILKAVMKMRGASSIHPWRTETLIVQKILALPCQKAKKTLFRSVDHEDCICGEGRETLFLQIQNIVLVDTFIGGKY